MNYILENQIPIPEPDVIKWAKWFEKSSRQIKRDKINNIIISTVFLGIDHRFGQGEPLLFETMIFGGKHDEFQERYSTWNEAIKGHEIAVKLVKDSL